MSRLPWFRTAKGGKVCDRRNVLFSFKWKGVEMKDEKIKDDHRWLTPDKLQGSQAVR